MRLGSIALPFLAVFSSICSLSQTVTPKQLIRDVRVFDGESVLEHRSVLIENGKISRIAGISLKVPDAEIVDGRGRTLLPGLFDAHVHMPDKMEDAARQALGFGVTTQLDMFNGGDRLKKIKQMEAEDRPDLADVRTAGCRSDRARGSSYTDGRRSDSNAYKAGRSTGLGRRPHRRRIRLHKDHSR